MIIGSTQRLTIGAIHDEGMTDNEAQPHPGMPCRVVREATLAEWIADAEQDGVASHYIAEVVMACALYGDSFFYEVLID